MSDADGPMPDLVLRPIGVVHSPFSERLQAPRQPAAALGIEGRIELFAGTGIEHALEDLESFRHIWVLFWFHRNHGFRPKVLPPRSQERRGVFATRSPYRPNPIGLSALELLKIEGRILYVRNLDILDQTPVLDLKPYVPYTDAIADTSSGWLEQATQPADPVPEYHVEFAARAREQLAFLEQRYQVSLRAAVEDVLRLGPQPHPYRRIKRQGDDYVLAHKAWRFRFTSESQAICVRELTSGYRASELFSSQEPALEMHRAFVEHFGSARWH